MVDIRQTLYYANYMRYKGWHVERINEINYFIRKIPLLGSVLKVQKPIKIDFKIINKLQRKHKVFKTIIEPSLTNQANKDVNLLIENDYKLSKSPFSPSKTLQIDLTNSKHKILGEFKKDARQAIKRGAAVLIKEYSTPSEIKIWRDGWKNCVNIGRFVPSENDLINLSKSFPQNHSIFLASHNVFGSIIGGALFTISSHGKSKYITYYWQGFTNKEGRSSLSQYALLYQGILWGKRQGCKIFDFEGIYDERFPNKSWLGFTHFKKSFGGKEILYPGAFVKNNFLSSLFSH